jgi:intracellular multiplication protein IcmE
LEVGFTENVNHVVAIFKTRQCFEDAGISMQILMSADDDATARRLELNLKGSGYTATELRATGYTATDFRVISDPVGKNAHQTALTLRCAGFSIKEILDAGYTIRKLREVGFPPSSFEGFSDKELKQAGFTFGELYQGGRSLSQLLDAGFTVENVVQAGFTAGSFGISAGVLA